MFSKAKNNRLSSSFRDPSGFLFTENGMLFRSVSRHYQKHYDHLIQSGLYAKLIESKLLIPHEEVNPGTIEDYPGKREDIYKIIQPEHIPFISYPYEWCFSQLKDAALATLNIQKHALDHGMVLKDASAYNMQFHKGSPLIIDTLSFEIHEENQAWVAYRQFCQHFLAPLSLMAFLDIRLGQLLRVYIDGIPLDLASALLPKISWINFGLLTHIHLHAKAQKRYEKTGAKNEGLRPAKIRDLGHVPTSDLAGRKVSKTALLGIIDTLETSINKMSWRPAGTEWAEYYEDTNYSHEAMISKKRLVEIYLNESKQHRIWDLGANTGVFSRIATAKNIDTIAFDVDPAAVEKNYRQMQENRETKILPLCLDLTNPSPSIGWANDERHSLIERGPADTVLALALIHHLAISNNLPFSHIANFLSRICRFLIIEFVPKDDSQVQRLLSARQDIFYHYSQDNFEASFQDYFSILKCEKIVDTQRVIYLMERNDMERNDAD